MPYPSPMLELAGANSLQISRFIGDMQQAHGMSSLRARYISKTDERGDRTKVLVLFVRTGKENIVDRMINFFDKAAQNRLAVTAMQQRIPGFFQAVGNEHGSVVGLPKSISVNAAAAQSDARKSFALSAWCTELLLHSSPRERRPFAARFCRRAAPAWPSSLPNRHSMHWT